MLFAGIYVNDSRFAQIAVEFFYLLVLELYHSVSQSVERGISAHADVASRVEFGAVLADNNLAFFYGLVAKDFYA